MKNDLLLDNRNGYDRLPPEALPEIEAYCGQYMHFLSKAKTEREAVEYTIAMAQKNGYRPFVPGEPLKPGDKVYLNNRNKSVYFAKIGTKPLHEGAHITAAHLDSPRLDLKPNPLYEENELAFFKTHYYGGIKKYQWNTQPLALHGVVVLTNGETRTVCIGERPEEPVFYITDLLIHLSADQMKKPMTEGVKAEQLNILLGSRPLTGEGSDRVKLAVLTHLFDTYGIVEEDFQSAELCLVPAGPARYVGFDKSLICGYGHDDRVCAFAAFLPMLGDSIPAYTSVCLLADKEEIGSVGVSGMKSQAFDGFMEALCGEASLRDCFANAFCLSADVTAAFDPDYAEAFDKRNAAYLNGGIGICKYTGSRGKSGASDASAEAMAYVRRIFRDAGVLWQVSDMGKVDQGGGGTVAGYLANRNIVTVDAGVPVLSMHAPWEVVASLDCYMTKKAMEAFYLAEE